MQQSTSGVLQKVSPATHLSSAGVLSFRSDEGILINRSEMCTDELESSSAKVSPTASSTNAEVKDELAGSSAKVSPIASSGNAEVTDELAGSSAKVSPTASSANADVSLEGTESADENISCSTSTPSLVIDDQTSSTAQSPIVDSLDSTTSNTNDQSTISKEKHSASEALLVHKPYTEEHVSFHKPASYIKEKITPLTSSTPFEGAPTSVPDSKPSASASSDLPYSAERITPESSCLSSFSYTKNLRSDSRPVSYAGSSRTLTKPASYTEKSESTPAVTSSVQPSQAVDEQTKVSKGSNRQLFRQDEEKVYGQISNQVPDSQSPDRLDADEPQVAQQNVIERVNQEAECRKVQADSIVEELDCLVSTTSGTKSSILKSSGTPAGQSNGVSSGRNSVTFSEKMDMRLYEIDDEEKVKILLALLYCSTWV